MSNATTLSTGMTRHTPQCAEAFTGRLGAIYPFDNGIAPHVSDAQSFEPQSGTDRNGSPFDPTEGERYDVDDDLGRATPALKGTNVALSVSNLFDKEYFASCYSESWCWYGYQRSIRASLRYRGLGHRARRRQVAPTGTGA